MTRPAACPCCGNVPAVRRVVDRFPDNDPRYREIRSYVCVDVRCEEQSYATRVEAVAAWNLQVGRMTKGTPT